jgi:hypothetical protein
MSTSSRPTLIASVSWAAAAAASVALIGWSCVPEEDPVDTGPPMGVHALFPLTGAHAGQNCDACHVDGAVEQGLASPGSGDFITNLAIECETCHLDVTQAFFPQGHMEGRSCADGGGCHSASDFCWKQVRTDCGDIVLDDTGIEINHSVEPLSDIFPLDGPHGALSCGDCHPGQESEQRGGAMFCDDCHEADRPIDHYPPPREGAESKERGCKACHASENADRQLVVPADWTSNASVHDFIWPHSVVNDWDEIPPVLKLEDDWTTSCDGCHLTANYDTYICSEACHTRAEIDPLSSLHANVTYDQCADCHAEGIQ